MTVIEDHLVRAAAYAAYGSPKAQPPHEREVAFMASIAHSMLVIAMTLQQSINLDAIEALIDQRKGAR